MGVVVADPAPFQLHGKGAGKIWEIIFFEIKEKPPKQQEKSIRMEKLQIFKTQPKIEDDVVLLPCAPYPQSFFIPRCLSEARSILQEIRKSKKLRRFSLCESA